MSLYKRGDVWHYDFTVRGNRYRGSTSEGSKTRAAQEEERLRRIAKDAILGPSAREVLTLEQAADRWFASRAKAKSAKTTARRLDIMIRLLGPHTLVTEIGAPEIVDAIEKRRLEATRQSTQRKGATPKPPSNSTINRDLIDTTLRPILNYCADTLELPIRRIPWKKLKLEEPTERTRTFTRAEVDAWLAHLPAWHHPIHAFAARYGVRLREAFFRLSAVDEEAWRITLRPADRKNKRAHTIRLLPDDAADIAARIGRARKAGLDTVWFREMKDGELTPIHWRGFQSASKTALLRAGIADARPAHDLRHHAATTMLRRTKGNLAAVQRLLGHKNLQSTMRYSHLTDDDVFDALCHAYGTNTGEAAESIVETTADTGT